MPCSVAAPQHSCAKHNNSGAQVPIYFALRPAGSSCVPIALADGERTATPTDAPAATLTENMRLLLDLVVRKFSGTAPTGNLKAAAGLANGTLYRSLDTLLEQQLLTADGLARSRQRTFAATRAAYVALGLLPPATAAPPSVRPFPLPIPMGMGESDTAPTGEAEPATDSAAGVVANGDDSLPFPHPVGVGMDGIMDESDPLPTEADPEPIVLCQADPSVPSPDLPAPTDPPTIRVFVAPFVAGQWHPSIRVFVASMRSWSASLRAPPLATGGGTVRCKTVYRTPAPLRERSL